MTVGVHVLAVLAAVACVAGACKVVADVHRAKRRAALVTRYVAAERVTRVAGICSACDQPLVLSRENGKPVARCPCGASSIPAAFFRSRG